MVALMKKEFSFERLSQAQCGQVLNSLKIACTLPCSQGGYRENGLKCDFAISAHRQSLEFKSFYGLWGFFRKWGESSPILTTLPHHTDKAKWSGLERIEVSKLRWGRS